MNGLTKALSACRQHEVYRLMLLLPSAGRKDSKASPTSHAFLLVYAVAGLMFRGTRTFPAHRLWALQLSRLTPEPTPIHYLASPEEAGKRHSLMCCIDLGTCHSIWHSQTLVSCNNFMTSVSLRVEFAKWSSGIRFLTSLLFTPLYAGLQDNGWNDHSPHKYFSLQISVIVVWSVIGWWRVTHGWPFPTPLLCAWPKDVKC